MKKNLKNNNILFIIISLTLIGLAVYVRFPLINFLPMIGDAGEYTNVANQLARTGRGFSNFLPVTWLYLAGISKIFGMDGIIYGPLIISILSIFTFFFLIKNIYSDKWIALIASFLFSINPLTIWMAKLPYSENLMLLFNLFTLLFLYKYSKREKPLYATLALTSLGLGYLTRATSLIWIIILSLYFIVRSFKEEKVRKNYLIIWNANYLLYILSVFYGIFIIPSKYIEGYWKHYIPFANGISIILTHLLAFLFVNTLIFYLIRKKEVIIKLKEIVKKRRRFLLKNCIILSIIGIFLSQTIFILKYRDEVSNFINQAWEFKSLISNIVTLLLRLNLIYSLVWYFSPLGLFLFPFALWIYVKNIFKSKRNLLLTVFSGFSIVIFSSFAFIQRDHAFYMYWDRYSLAFFLPALFLIFTHWIIQTIISKKKEIVITIFFLLGYLINSSIWIASSKEIKFLNGYTKSINLVTKNIQYNNTVIVSANKLDYKFIFPNIERVFLLPLEQSFGYTINKTEKITMDPFAEDPDINYNSVKEHLNNNKRVYVITLSDRHNPGLETPDGLEERLVIEEKQKIYLKKHIHTNIFQKNNDEYEFWMSIYEVKKRT